LGDDKAGYRKIHARQAVYRNGWYYHYFPWLALHTKLDWMTVHENADKAINLKLLQGLGNHVLVCIAQYRYVKTSVAFYELLFLPFSSGSLMI